MRKARQYVPMFNDPAYAVHVDTEHRTVPDIVAQLLSYIAGSAPVAR